MSSKSSPTLPSDSRPTKKINKELIIEEQNGILIIRINRPERKNALNRKALYQLIAAMENATHNNAIKMVVITGVGDIYSSGNDLKQIQEYKKPEDFNRGANYVLRALIKAFILCPKLLVCLVNGPCIGVGFTLTALCDAVYCTRNTYFHTNFTQLGICPEACSSLTFSQHFGQSWATNLLVFGEKLTAEKAEQLGFVLEVFDNNMEIEEKFWPKMREYVKLPDESLKVTKRLIKAHNRNGLLNALELELNEIQKLRQGPIYRQAMQKFIQKSKKFKSKL